MVVGSVSRGCQVVVIGAGPGGYVAALRLAQLGKDVILVEKSPTLGGVCLNVGCIPSKALIHAADLAHEARHAGNMGLSVEGLTVDQPKMVAWKDGIVERLTTGVAFLCKQNGVEVVHGSAEFISDRALAVTSEEGRIEIEFEQAVLATGSRPMALNGFEHDGEKIIGSTEALSLQAVPDKMVVIGAGYIGLELGTVYAKLGSEVSIVEFLPEVAPNLDPEVGKALIRQLKKLKVELYLSHRAESFEPGEPSTVVARGPKDEELRLEADVVMMSVGRVPNVEGLGLEQAGVATDEKGFIEVNEKMQTSTPGIYAIGDVVGGALLAHKAYQEAKVAAEVIAGEPAAFDSVVPAVIYTDPEVAWVGLGEEEAKEKGYDVVTGTFPFKASGRAMSLDSTDGFVKAIADADSKQLLGVVAVGRGVSEFIGEATLALEMGAFLEDVGLTIHPHPTMSEALQEAVEGALGQAVHMVNKN
ncbi:MAG: dihydrolipoyl dehydrogenase [Acidobacteria bacterium]|nr:dihydrolipoyl dehydrogenase [Acidobacteriota bacterium]